MSPPIKQLEVKTNRTSFYTEIVADITTWKTQRNVDDNNHHLVIRTSNILMTSFST